MLAVGDGGGGGGTLLNIPLCTYISGRFCYRQVTTMFVKNLDFNMPPVGSDAEATGAHRYMVISL